MHMPHFIHPFKNWWTFMFLQGFMITHNIVMNILTHVLFHDHARVLWSIFLGVELWSKGSLNNDKLLSKMPIAFHAFSIIDWTFPFYHFLPIYYLYFFLKFSFCKLKKQNQTIHLFPITLTKCCWQPSICCLYLWKFLKNQYFTYKRSYGYLSFCMWLILVSITPLRIHNMVSHNLKLLLDVEKQFLNNIIVHILF